MGLAAGKEYDVCLARILPTGFCVSGHGYKASSLISKSYCRVLIITFPMTDEVDKLYKKAVMHGKLLRINRIYRMDLDYSACSDSSALVDRSSLTIDNNGENYDVAVIEYKGKLLIFISADITHACRCVETNILTILKMIKEIYEAWSGKDMTTLIDLDNSTEILKYLSTTSTLPVINAVCDGNGIHITTGGRMIVAFKNLQFKITRYSCYEKEFPLDRELEFNSDVRVKFEYINGELSLVDVISSLTAPITIGDQADCHENINKKTGEVCLGSFTRKVEKIDLSMFNNNLCSALEYVFNVIQSALEKPNVCNSYQSCYSTKYGSEVGHDEEYEDDDEYYDDGDEYYEDEG